MGSDIKESKTGNSLYKRLADQDEIRLLYLQPGLTSDPIVCQVAHAKFLDKTEYEALSYMWGNEDSPLPIQLYGTILKVRNNLWQALKHIRLPRFVRILWIDAICINQEDLRERNHQVSQMGRIYENAIRVVAWLGLSDDSSRIAMNYIRDFRKGTPESKPGEPRRRQFPLIMDSNTISAISSFCTREYWTRLWIIQELIIPSNITLQCGEFTCNWSQFAFLLESAYIVMQQAKSVWKMDPEFSPFTKSVPKIIVRERKLHGSNLRRPLVDLCIDFGSSECADRRDKVFGLQAFTLPCCREALAVDYSLSILDMSRKLLLHYSTNHEQKFRTQDFVDDEGEYKLTGGLKIAAYAKISIEFCLSLSKTLTTWC
jgi:hypothetical protein